MQTAQQSCVNRVNKLGVASPNVARPGQRRDRHPARRHPRPGKAAAIIGSTGTAAVLRLREGSRAADRQRSGSPTPYPTPLQPAQAVAGPGEEGHPPGRTTSSARRRRSRQTVKGKKHDDDDQARGSAGRRPNAEAAARAVQAASKPHGHEDPRVPATPRARHGAGHRRGSAAGEGLAERHVLVPLQVLRRRAPNGPPEITGKDLNESGISRLDPTTGQPEVHLGFKGHGGRSSRRSRRTSTTAASVAAGLNGSPAQRPEPCQYAQHNAIVLDGKLQSTPYIDYTDSQLSLGIAGERGISSMGRSSAAKRPRARPPERLAAVHVQAARADRGLGDARQELAPPGDPRRARRPAHRRALPARALPLPRSRRGLRPRDLRGSSTTRRSSSSTSR